MSMELIKQLREMTNAGMLDCQKALKENDNDLEKAAEYLRKKGIAKAAKKADREAREGLVTSYIHTNNKVGVLLELNCETDFVARTDTFRELAHDICLHIAAAAPICIRREEVPDEAIEKEKVVYAEQLANEGKSETMIEKIVAGKVEKYYEQVCLVEQAFVKEPGKTIDDLVKESIAQLGENIQVKRFSRFVLGE